MNDIDYYRLLSIIGLFTNYDWCVVVVQEPVRCPGQDTDNDPESFGKFGSYIQDGEMFLEREERVRDLLNRRRLSERGVET